MVQFNLLPDVKINYIKAKRRKRAIISLSILVSVALLVIFALLLLYVQIAQKNHIRALTQDISQITEELESDPDNARVLTVQNQLNSLPSLHEQKVYASRLVLFLSQLTPELATISDVEANFEEKTLSVSGNADELSTVNKFVDTVKFTNYRLESDQQTGPDGPDVDQIEGKPAFSNVVLTEFGVVSDAGVNIEADKRVEFTITFTYDETIFSYIPDEDNLSANVVELIVPNIISTRSETEKPRGLFSPSPSTEFDDLTPEGTEE